MRHHNSQISSQFKSMKFAKKTVHNCIEIYNQPYKFTQHEKRKKKQNVTI